MGKDNRLFVNLINSPLSSGAGSGLPDRQGVNADGLYGNSYAFGKAIEEMEGKLNKVELLTYVINSDQIKASLNNNGCFSLAISCKHQGRS